MLIFAAKLSQESDMSNPENASVPATVSSPPLRTWDFLETTLVALIAYGVFTLTAQLALTYVLTMHGTRALSPAEFRAPTPLRRRTVPVVAIACFCCFSPWAAAFTKLAYGLPSSWAFDGQTRHKKAKGT